MGVKESVKAVESSEVFRQWREGHAEAFLAHVFVLKEQVQVGYYSKASGTLASFALDGGKVVLSVHDELLRQPGSSVEELVLDQVSLSEEQALAAADKVREEHYAREGVLKRFFVLQVLSGIPVFNITYITRSFKTLNIRIGARDGVTVQHSLRSLVEMSPGNGND